MAVKIRLARKGRKKVPYYWVIVTDSKNPRNSRYIEHIGTYDPLLNDDNSKRINIKMDRYDHWIKLGAQPTETVERLSNKIKSI